VTALKRNAVARWTIAASLFVAGSCAPVSQGSLANPHAPYDTKAAADTFAFGYTSIVERHLERVTAAMVALEGMRGLAAIDPEIGVSRLDDKVLLSSSEHVAAEYPAPAENDVRGWARLTVTVALEARGLSAKMKDSDLEKVYEAVFDATLAKLDMFSRYAGTTEAREHRASRNGFGGIGIKFDMIDDEARIIEVMDGGPAGIVGVQVGDIITQIEGESVSPLSKDEISKRLRGPVSSSVSLTVRRGFKPLDISMRRGHIVPPTVTAQVKDGMLEARIASFNEQTASSLRDALVKAVDDGVDLKGVVLDMRGNPGGLLDQAVAMADLFMSGGSIVSTKGRAPLANQAYDARQGDPGESLPVVILVDGKSASAAEIVAAALQDSGRAVVVGTNSYGKGTVQTVIRMPNDGEMTLTWSRFHTPTGYALHGLGVLPTICTAAARTANPAGLMDGVVHAALPPQVSVNLNLWRHTRLDETDLRKQLRATCPAARRGDDKADMELAESLLNDKLAYAQALSLSAPLAASVAARSAHLSQQQQAEH